MSELQEFKSFVNRQSDRRKINHESLLDCAIGEFYSENKGGWSVDAWFDGELRKELIQTVVRLLDIPPMNLWYILTDSNNANHFIPTYKELKKLLEQASNEN